MHLPLPDIVARVQQLSAVDRKIRKRIKDAGYARNWTAVQSELRACGAPATPLIDAAILASIRCGEYEDGLSIFDRHRNSGASLSAVSYGGSIRLCGRLGLKQRALSLWEEVQNSTVWHDNETAVSVACCMLDAVARTEDVQMAATVLDLMSDRGKQLNRADFSQALQSCRNAAAPAAAWYLYGQMLKHGVKPNVIVFSHLMGAHSNSSVAAIQKVIHNMTQSKVKPDTPFVEEHIGALLGTRYIGTANQARLAVTNSPQPHCAEALDVIQRSRQQGLKSSKLLQTVEKALKQRPK